MRSMNNPTLKILGGDDESNRKAISKDHLPESLRHLNRAERRGLVGKRRRRGMLKRD